MFTGHDKEPLDLQTKRIILAEMIDHQQRMEQQRSHNLDLLNDADGSLRAPFNEKKLPVNKQKVEWIIGSMKQVPDVSSQRELLLESIQRVSLAADLERLATAIAQGSLTSKNLDFIVDVCDFLHKMYADWSKLILESVKK